MDLVKALTTKGTRVELFKTVDQTGGYRLLVPKFGSGSSLSIKAEDKGTARTVDLVLTNRRGVLRSKFAVEAGQGEFPGASYTVTVSAASIRGPRSVRVPSVTIPFNPAPQITPAVERRLTAFAAAVKPFRMEADIKEVQAASGKLITSSLGAFGLGAVFLDLDELAVAKPSLFDVIWECGTGTALCVLGAIAAAGTGGAGIAAALVACGVVGGNCGKMIAEYVYGD